MPFTSLGLAPELVRAVADEGYEQPTPIQQEAIPLALAGRDLIGSAQTGTGKTAAFMLPILQRLSRNGVKHVLRALILVPTRELAEQVLQSARAYGRHLDVSAATWISRDSKCWYSTRPTACSTWASRPTCAASCGRSLQSGRRCSSRPRCRSKWMRSPVRRWTATPRSRSGGERSPRKGSST